MDMRESEWKSRQQLLHVVYMNEYSGVLGVGTNRWCHLLEETEMQWESYNQPHVCLRSVSLSLQPYIKQPDCTLCE